ncbi:hypothetical protein D5018_00280 [Parashewanella curva]|uniref:Tyrosine specific protein phosphatases domain-containing protein n=1 Tax=Parashewanella curva TaxID=2338552 RepID=A0A3L8Q279_9GAMM|nr:protein-tyrosine phosphatase family protein [Parashewanella curva]RLV61590.1 hypothetical protein D5018_00280 [Parashewanella curva]
MAVFPLQQTHISCDLESNPYISTIGKCHIKVRDEMWGIELASSEQASAAKLLLQIYLTESESAEIDELHALNAIKQTPLGNVWNLKQLRVTSSAKIYYSIPLDFIIRSNTTGFNTSDTRLVTEPNEQFPRKSLNKKFDELTRSTMLMWPASHQICRPKIGRFLGILVPTINLVPINVLISDNNQPLSIKGLISANYITVHPFPKAKLIATEYPYHDSPYSPEHPELFWKLVFQQNIGLIVDLSYSFESALPYYPQKTNLTFGSMTVIYTKTDDDIHQYQLVNNEKQSCKRVQRLHINNWPSSVTYDLTLLDELVCKIAPKLIDRGVLIHCNSGIGKTGVVLNALNLFNYRSQVISPSVSIEKITDSSILNLRLQKSPKLVRTPLMRQNIIDLVKKWQNAFSSDV